MEMQQFIEKLLAAAKEQGIDPAEAYVSAGSSFSANVMQGTIDAYNVSTRQGLGLRGVYQGKMGYASTQAFDDEAIQQLIEGVKEGASLREDEDAEEIYPGDASYPTVDSWSQELEQVSAAQKLDACLNIEKAAVSSQPTVTQCSGTRVGTASGEIRLCNSYGLNLHHRSNMYLAYTDAIAQEGDSTATAMAFQSGRNFAEVDPQALGAKAARDAAEALHGSPVPAGSYRIILRWDAMQALLETFAGIFSAENTQQGLSLLKGREGETIAAPCVTLMDDPLLPGGFASSPFDEEGVACRTKAVVEAGVLKTLLHNRKTAKKQGVASTGNAARPGLSAPVTVAPSNLFFKPGEQSLEELEAQMGDGLVITDLSGLHSGANTTSGDFSLLSKGYLLEGGKRVRPVEQITVAGNFYQLLKNIRALGNDLTFPASGVGAPSVDVGTLAVSGK